MSQWVRERLEALLNQINEVPYTDDRDERQLTILTNGFAKLNNEALGNAASKIKNQMRNWSLEEASEKERKKRAKEKEGADELTRLRPIG